ncbi:MAG: hypothetical protein HQ517_15415 [SAR324 cluster bacterium]|nr:hypothetical protein [SAR324 cluster bacterium]
MENLIDYLIPLIVILGFLSFKAKRKQAKAQTKTADEPKKEGTGLFGKLNGMLEEYLASDLKGAPRKRDSSWVDDAYEMDTEYSYTEPDSDEDEVPVPEMMIRKVPETVTRKVPEPKPVLRPKPETKKRQAKAPSEYLFKNVSKQDLRKAIIWSEILGPPIALREK